MRVRRARNERLTMVPGVGIVRKAPSSRGGTKPAVHTKGANRFKDGRKGSGGMKTKRHAGPTRKSKTPPSGVKGAQLQKRMQP